MKELPPDVLLSGILMCLLDLIMICPSISNSQAQFQKPLIIDLQGKMPTLIGTTCIIY